MLQQQRGAGIQFAMAEDSRQGQVGLLLPVKRLGLLQPVKFVVGPELQVPEAAMAGRVGFFAAFAQCGAGFADAFTTGVVSADDPAFLYLSGNQLKQCQGLLLGFRPQQNDLFVRNILWLRNGKTHLRFPQRPVCLSGQPVPGQNLSARGFQQCLPAGG